MIIYLTLALLLLGGIVLFFFLVYRVKLNRSIKERKEIENRNFQTLLQTKVEIRDQTLKDVSREIHDNIAQILSLAKLHLSSAQSLDIEQVMIRLSSAKELVGRAIQDLRDLSKVLSAEQIEHFNLIQAIEQQVDQVRKTGTHEFIFDVIGTPVSIEHQNGVVLFRIIQEALHNVVKHASATRVELELAFGDKDLRVRIKDNGVGFDLLTRPKGQGLGNIQERSELLGASFSIASNSEDGTCIMIVMPIKKIGV